MMEDRTKKLDDFIREIISYARNARTPVQPEYVDLKNLAFEILGNLSYLEGANLVRIDFKLDEARTVLADKMRLRAVMTNLIANAIKYHNYTADDPWIRIETRKTLEGISLSVTDNGSGIPANHIDKVFDMFYRASEKSDGSGIGLYIVKEMVQKMNGRVELTSDFGKGSVFTVHLPAS
jgi:signal transduction histidine kinase